jgi:hypothetical protein
VVLCVSQDHTCVHAKDVSELVSPPPPQWLVDLFRLSDFAWRQARPSCVLLSHVRPEAFPVVENLLIEVSPVISVGTPSWILLEAIDDPLRNGRLICRQVRGRDSPCRGTRNLPDRSRRLGMVRKLHWLRRDPGKLPRAARRADPPRGKLRSPLLRVKLLRFEFA